MAAQKMMVDDSGLTSPQLAKICREARRALEAAGVWGFLPTPVDKIFNVAQVTEIKEDVLSDSYLHSIRRGITDAYRRARSKVLGLFSSVAGLVVIDQLLHPLRKRFVSFHEAAHGFLGWQRSMYKLVEDGEDAIEPDAAELFDREANVFASEVLFQNDTFQTMASDCEFSIWTPVKLARKFDASIYAAIRQYVSKNEHCCVVLVYNKPELVPGDGFRATLRRVVSSPSFAARFSTCTWPETVTPDHALGKLIPIGRKYSRPRRLYVTDVNDDRHECVAEAFTQTHQVFVLIHAVKALRRPRLIMPAGMSTLC